MDHWKDETRLLENLLSASGEIVRRFYRDLNRAEHISVKPALSPIVTEADRRVESCIRSMIQARFPEDGISGEELTPIRQKSRRQWVVDPIDGTISFALGRPTFATLVALTVDDVPILSAIDQPILGDRWLGRAGKKTTFNGRKVHTSAEIDRRRCSLAINGAERLLDDIRMLRAVAAIRSTIAWISFGGDCYSFAAVANGWLDAVIEIEAEWHDIAPVIPIIDGAGGAVVDVSGRGLRSGVSASVVVAASSALGRDLAASWRVAYND